MSAVLEAPTATRFTPDDLLRLPGGGRGFELVDGELQERNMSFLSAYTAGEIHGALREFVKPRGLGWLLPEGTSYRCFSDDPDRVRRADTSFFRLERLSMEEALAPGHVTLVPDFVVDVLSPNDLAYEVAGKRREWLEAGVQLVWIVYPEQKEIQSYRPDGLGRHFYLGDAITADPVLPGFEVPLAELFRLPLPKGQPS